MSTTLYNGQSGNVTLVGSWTSYLNYENYTQDAHADGSAHWTITPTLGDTCTFGLGWVEMGNRGTTLRITIDDGSSTLFTALYDGTVDVVTWAGSHGYTTSFYTDFASGGVDHDVVNFYTGTAGTTTYRVWIWKEGTSGDGSYITADFLAFTATTPSGTSIDPGDATETFTGVSPTLKLAIKPATVTETFTGASTALQMAIKPGVVSEALTGASLALKLAIKPGTGTESLTGASPQLFYGTLKTPGAATETFTGASPALMMAYRPTTGSELFSGIGASFNLAIPPTTRSESFTMGTPGLLVGPTIPVLSLVHEIAAVLLEDDDNPFGIDPFHTEYLL